MKSFKKFLLEADNRNEYPGIYSEARRRLAFEREAMGMPGSDIYLYRNRNYVPTTEEEANSSTNSPDTIKVRRMTQLINQIQQERKAEYPEEAAKFEKNQENLKKYKQYQETLDNQIGLPKLVYDYLKGSLDKKIIKSMDNDANPVGSSNDEALHNAYPNDFSKEQITGKEPSIQTAPSAVDRPENKVSLNRVVPNKDNPSGMRNVTSWRGLNHVLD